MQLFIVTDIPSPYQVELFDAVARRPDIALTVAYVRRNASDRQWEPGALAHKHFFLAEASESVATSAVYNCDLAVFNGYRPAGVRRLMGQRRRSGKPWAFWGERPGFRLRGRLGQAYRAWALRHVRKSAVPVWGIGTWGVEGYRAELGEGHQFFDVPYVFDLKRYFAIERRFEANGRCRFLFSGSFIRRKGIDLVMPAFGQLVAEGRDVELHVMGAGPMEGALKALSSPFASRVHMHGFKQWRDLASIYANADVLCAPSRYDGWGMVVVEGLAAGMPVISTDSTGAALELIEPQCGWIVPAGDERALLSAMRAATDLGHDRLKEMSEHARKAGAKQDLEAGVDRFLHAAETSKRSWTGSTRRH